MKQFQLRKKINILREPQQSLDNRPKFSEKYSWVVLTGNFMVNSILEKGLRKEPEVRASNFLVGTSKKILDHFD